MLYSGTSVFIPSLFSQALIYLYLPVLPAPGIDEHIIFISSCSPRPAPGIASLMSIAGDCLRDHSGRVFYVGADLFGIVGFIDSSEMVSTFGSTHEEVRGFVSGGWSVCKNRDGSRSKNDN